MEHHSSLPMGEPVWQPRQCRTTEIRGPTPAAGSLDDKGFAMNHMHMLCHWICDMMGGCPMMGRPM